jgi:hypothetical protein
MKITKPIFIEDIRFGTFNTFIRPGASGFVLSFVLFAFDGFLVTAQSALSLETRHRLPLSVSPFRQANTNVTVGV